jgi:tRNA(Ile)-lysidine synthase
MMAERVDTAGEARRTRRSIEAAARHLRYAALERMLQAWRGDFIATAHTEDDQAETVLMHLFRGSGGTGLGGMREVQGSIVRPFLGVSRHTVLAWLAAVDQPFRTDESNRDTRFTRNRVRAAVMPALRTINPQVAQRIVGTARTLRADVDFLEDQARKALAALTVSSAEKSLVLNRTGWASLAPALSAAVAREVIRSVLGDVQNIHEKHIVTIVHAVGSASSPEGQLPRGLFLEVDESVVELSAGPPPHPAHVGDVAVPVPGEVSVPAGKMRGSLLPPRTDVAALIAVAGPFHALLDADAAGQSLRLRARLPGDRMEPIGINGTKKVQDIMVDALVPARARDAVPILVNAHHILWIPGLALDRRAAAVPASRHILHLIWTPNT